MSTPTIRDNPVVLDKGSYWLICIPVPPDNVGWHWKALIWIKGQDHELTHVFKRTIGDIEAHAAKFMNP